MKVTGKNPFLANWPWREGLKTIVQGMLTIVARPFLDRFFLRQDLPLTKLSLPLNIGINETTCNLLLGALARVPIVIRIPPGAPPVLLLVPEQL